MTPCVTVVDYGMGNLFSVEKAFQHCGAKVTVTADPDQVVSAERLVLPGVGAFADGMRELKSRNLITAIKDFSQTGRLFLGICLGMQMMMDEGEEHGFHEGLALVPGRVTAIPARKADGMLRKIPHIGWDSLCLPDGAPSWEGTLLSGVNLGDAVYFVHSYRAVPADEGHRLADCCYEGTKIAAVIRRDNLWGCQFHPEKSGPVGLKIIGNFLEMRGTHARPAAGRFIQ